ncbi:YlbF family regulator [Halobacillus litoralis]|uniref:YlbF family regulator n=1 Tax=Halobacillus litoralis TaxID=45668 RepID=UPI001CD47C32|nr:YlbF family regulator [Halobacillus litoralis]MCA0971412.1 YlbF family regulator [Halobacillus litoralis]
MKKLWNPKVLIGILLISLFFYEFFLSFYFEYFPNGRPTADMHKINVEMIEDYGHTLDESEFEGVQLWFEETNKEAQAYLEQDPTARELGITSYQSLHEKLADAEFGSAEYKKMDQLYSRIMFEEEVDAFWEIQGYETMMRHYEDSSTISHPVDGIEDNFHSILPYYVYENFQNLILKTGTLITIVVSLVIGLVHLPDQRKNMLPIQYVTRKGRRLFKSKLIASLVTTLVVTTIYLGAFFLLYSQNGTSPFFDSSLRSFELGLGVMFWYDFTFGEYILATVTIIYGVAILSALLSFVISRLVSNYLALVGIQICVTTSMALIFSTFLLVRLFSTDFSLWVYWAWIGVLGVIGICALLWRNRIEWTVDVF